MAFGYPINYSNGRPLWNVSKPEQKAPPREIVERMVLAGEILHDTLEKIPKEWAVGYIRGFNKLVALIEQHKGILNEPKKPLDITRAL